jgi:hypothetical protein
VDGSMMALTLVTLSAGLVVDLLNGIRILAEAQ